MSDNGENGPVFPEPNTNPISGADLIEQEIAEGKLVLSEMGKRMLAACRRIEQSGVPLLNRDELDQERTARRGAS